MIVIFQQIIGDIRNLPKRLIKKALFIAAAIGAGTLFLATIGVVTLLVVDGRAGSPPDVQPTPVPVESESYEDSYEEPAEPDTDDDEAESDEGSLLRPPAKTNFMLIGIDHNNLTDAIIVGSFYRDSGDIKLMSIPRDMYTRLPDHRLEQMRAEGLRPPSTMKINALRAFGGRNGVYYLKAQLGEMLGIELDYYVEVQMDAFIRLVDAIGGVYFDVPMRMFYNPRCQDDLNINLQPGLQHIDGATAIGLVRFRGFRTGDVGRNETHVEFMTQVISQMLTREAIMNDPLAMINIVLNDVTTNIGLNAVRYIPFIGNMSSERITTFVMPGEGRYINRISWFIPDAAKVPDVINQMFYAEITVEAEEE